ncbi:hypothetical protein [Candidatus Rhodobacter oscarellae]|uniref:hypothetical protein n=1 Tax=Candidatus Rhodobacter oscarellae TaxID=1675527 RepID=UPI00128EF0A0|nr:hypothetical protein [Candidatus Rhodobacter lobularis]
MALSVASAVTTYLGLNSFTEFFLVSAGGTFGIQSLLFAISWWLGQNWRRGFGYISVGAIVFLTCASVSVFFSFASLYVAIDNGRSDESAKLRMRSLLNSLEVELEDKVEANLAAQKGNFVADDPTQAWIQNISEVLSLARAAPQKLETAARNERDEKLRERLAQETELLRVEAEIIAATTSNESFAAQVAQLQSRLNDAKAARERLEDDIVQLTNAIDANQLRRDDEASRGGCGPKCKDIEEEMEDQRRDLIGLEANLSRAVEVEAARKREVDDVANSSIQGAELARLNGEKAVYNARVKEIDRDLALIDAKLDQPVLGNVATIEEKLNRFAGLDFSKFNETVSECDDLRQKLIDSKAADPSVIPTCRGSALVGEIQKIGDQAKILDTLRQDCDMQKVIGKGLSFAQMNEFGAMCISRAQIVDPDITAMQDNLFQIAQSRGPNAHPFAKTQAALFVDKDPLAYLALALAIAIDALILLCALIGTNVGKSQLVRSVQYMLAHRNDDPKEADLQMVQEPQDRQNRLLFEHAVEWITARGEGNYVLDETRETRMFKFPTSLVDQMRAVLRDQDGSNSDIGAPTNAGTGSAPPSGTSKPQGPAGRVRKIKRP